MIFFRYTTPSSAAEQTCDCSITDNYGDNCEIGICGAIYCGIHGSEIPSVNDCECLCDHGYTGSLCELTIPTEIEDPCIDNMICTELGQTCSEENLCTCDTENGYIKDDFLPSETYGKCVGQVPSCIRKSDCLLNQECIDGFCTCIDLPGVGEMCLKGEVYQFYRQIF
jgi:hypothetical protein